MTTSGGTSKQTIYEILFQKQDAVVEATNMGRVLLVSVDDRIQSLEVEHLTTSELLLLGIYLKLMGKPPVLTSTADSANLEVAAKPRRGRPSTKKE